MAGIDTEAVFERRDFFPRGLIQPEGGYRFSLDSLLVARFAQPGRRHVGIDLGCGCGVISFALLLQEPGLTLTGVELETASVDAARQNSELLYFNRQLSIVQGNVRQWRPEKVVDFVISNPPFRKLGQGRVSQGAHKSAARFEESGSFGDFARCAANALKTRGKFVFIHLPERLGELMQGLVAAKLEPKRMRMVHGRADEPARMVMIEAVKAAGPGMKVEPPLILHAGTGRETALSQQVLDYCPFLGCNGGDGDA